MNNLTRELTEVRKRIGPKTGICTAYRNTTKRCMVNFALDHGIDWTKWEHYSGEVNYPIAGRSAYWDEHQTETMHINPRRYQLIDWMIEQSKVRWRLTENGLYFKGQRLPIEIDNHDADIRMVRAAFDLTPASMWVRKFVAESPGVFRAVGWREHLANSKELLDKYRGHKDVRYYINSYYM